MHCQSSLVKSSSSRINLTALYTSFVWWRSGLSQRLPSVFAWLTYWLFKPIVLGFKYGARIDLDSFLVQRHFLIDDLLTQHLSRTPSVVIELASGHAERGRRFLEQLSSQVILYLELDLPDMIAHKSHLSTENHRFVPWDLTARSGPLSLADIIKREVKGDYPLVIITEGLLPYFSRETVIGLWKDLAGFIDGRGLYLSDLIAIDNANSGGIAQFGRIIGRVANSRVTVHFRSPEEAISALILAGFRTAKIHSKPLSSKRRQRESIANVIEAR